MKDYYLARYIVKSTVVLFFLQNFTYKKRVWGKLQTIPYSMSYTYNIQEIYFQMIQIDLFQETVKYKPPTSSFSTPFPFSNVFYYRLFLVGFSRFSPLTSWSLGRFQGAKLRSALPLLATKWASAKWPKSWVFRRDSCFGIRRLKLAEPKKSRKGGVISPLLRGSGCLVTGYM